MTKKSPHYIFSLLLTLAIVITMFPGMAMAAGHPWALTGDVTVTGTIGTPITNTDVVITLVNDNFMLKADQPWNPTSWITNLPPGLTAGVKNQVVSGAHSLTLTLSGKPTAASTAIITITIPAADLMSSADLTAVANPNAKFAITDTRSATVGDATVHGTAGSAVANTDIVVTVVNDSFKKLDWGADLTSWITNLPLGLTAKNKNTVNNEAQSLTMTISGTPKETSNQVMAIKIPAADLISGADLTVAANANAKFAITDTRSATIGDVTVTGTVGKTISSTDVVVNLVNDSIAYSIDQGTDLTSWILTNFPPGLTAKLKNRVVSGGQSLTLTISGKPTATSNEVIAITIPGGMMLSSKAMLPVDTNPNAKFAITDTRSATVKDVTVTGTICSAIRPKEVTITLTNDSFPPNSQGDVTSWFTNLPAGLTAAMNFAGAITISGTPTVESSEAMAIKIPGAKLSSGADLAVTTNPNAKFAITDTRSAAVGDATVTGATGSALTKTDLVITLINDSFASALYPGMDLTNWVTNIPPCLSATPKNTVPKGGKSLTLTLGGTPVTTSNAVMAITIPATSLSSGADLTATANPNALFDITTPTYTVTFDKNSGDTEANPVDINVVSGSSVGTLPTPPTRKGYTFSGWEDGSGNAFDATTPVTASITVYAQWTPVASAIIDIPSITGVTVPVIGATPVSTLPGNSEYTATISWTPADGTFAANTVYKATITITPKDGYTLTGIPANFFTVAGATAANAADSGLVTTVFPRTEAVIPAQNAPLGNVSDMWGHTYNVVLKYYPVASGPTSNYEYIVTCDGYSKTLKGTSDFNSFFPILLDARQKYTSDNSTSKADAAQAYQVITGKLPW